MENRYLFRGKRKKWELFPEAQQWVQGYYVHTAESDYIVSPYEHTTLLGEGETVEIEVNTLCQCTGLKDKNGKLIWENDVVRFQFDNDDCPFPNKDTKKRIGKVFFSDFRASWSIAMGRKCSKALNNDLFKYVQNGNRVEVIGSAFDNPELLESED